MQEMQRGVVMLLPVLKSGGSLDLGWLNEFDFEKEGRRHYNHLMIKYGYILQYSFCWFGDLMGVRLEVETGES